MSPAARLGAAAALMLLSPGLAVAGVVVHDGGVGRDKDAAARVEERTSERPSRVLSDDVLAGPSRPLAAELTQEPCEGDSIQFDAGDRVDKVLAAVLEFDLEGADASLVELRTLLACSAELVPARTLARVSFLEGALRFDQGVPEQASAAMADAAVFDWEYTGERGFPAAHLELLSAAREGLRPGRLFLWPGPGVKTVYVDGQEVEGAGINGAELGRGLHLVQLETADGLRGIWLRTRGAQSTLVLPGAGRSLWRDASRGEGALAGLNLVIADEFGGRAGDVHVLQYRGRARWAATWPGGGGAPTLWDEDDESATASTDKPGARPKTAGKGKGKAKAKAKDKDKDKDKAAKTPTPPTAGEDRFRVAVGGGWQFVDPFHYALISVEVGVRVVGPLEIGALVRPAFGGVHEFPTPEGAAPIVGPLFFVPFGGYVAVRKPGAVSPWGGVAGHIAWNQDRLVSPEWMGGVTGIGGIDLAPGDGPVYVRIQGEAGFLWESFTGRFAVGVGLRL